jgi:hypothetical protein
LIFTSIGCSSNWGLALKSCLVLIGLRLNIFPFLHGLGASNDLLTKVHFLGDGMAFRGQSQLKF